MADMSGSKAANLFNTVLGAYLRPINYGNELDARNANRFELDRSARLEDANAVDSLARGAIAAGQARMRGTLLGAKQRVAYAASGVDASTGTAASVINSTSIYSELDARTLSNNALRESLGHKEVGRKYRQQRARLDQEQQASDAALGFGLASDAVSVVSTLLGGG